MPETKTFNCPSCGAALDPKNNAAEIKCAYCGNSITITEELRGPMTIAPQTTRWIKIGVWGFAILIVLTFVLPILCSFCGILAGLAGSVIPFFVK